MLAASEASIESSLASTGVPIEQILAANDCSSSSSGGSWVGNVGVRIMVAAWLMRYIDWGLVDEYAPKLASGEEDVAALGKVSEMMGIALPGHGMAFMGLGAAPPSRPASAATNGRGKAVAKGSGVDTQAAHQQGGGGGGGDGLDMLRLAMDLAREVDSWDAAGGWQALDRRRSGNRLVMAEVARVASLNAVEEGGELFAASASSILPTMPIPVVSAIANGKGEGPVRGGKVWAAALEEERETVRVLLARSADHLETAIEANYGCDFDGIEADIRGGERDAESGRLVEELVGLGASVARYSQLYESHVGSVVRRVAKPKLHSTLGNAAASVRDQKGDLTRLMGALNDIRSVIDLARRFISRACIARGCLAMRVLFEQCLVYGQLTRLVHPTWQESQRGGCWLS